MCVRLRGRGHQPGRVPSGQLVPGRWRGLRCHMCPVVGPTCISPLHMLSPPSPPATHAALILAAVPLMPLAPRPPPPPNTAPATPTAWRPAPAADALSPPAPPPHHPVHHLQPVWLWKLGPAHPVRLRHRLVAGRLTRLLTVGDDDKLPSPDKLHLTKKAPFSLPFSLMSGLLLLLVGGRC